jgi:hypothetical protein
MELKKQLQVMAAYANSVKKPPLFRGQADSNWMMTTNYYRNFASKFDVPKISDFSDLDLYLNEETINKDYSDFHDKLIVEFVSLCVKEIGLTVAHPKYPALLDSNFYLSLAQHYGLPTNLLDLTVSPLVIITVFLVVSDELTFVAKIKRQIRIMSTGVAG